jgi:hypothetical protein
MPTDEETIRVALRNDIRRKARTRVWVKLAFMWHLVVFVMANAAMLAINLTYSPQTLWFVWPLVGWGSGLALHGLATFTGTKLTEDMVETEVERELERRGLKG